MSANESMLGSESMRRLAHWTSVHAPADDDLDSIRAAYDALCRNYTPVRSKNIQVIDGLLPDGALPYRIYRPHTPTDALIFYIHGGGFMMGGLDSHESITAPLALAANAWVLCLDYRLAPEQVYPAAVEDVQAAWRFIHAQAAHWGIDCNKIMLAGDSAGGNLAAGLALHAPKACALALVYPCLSMTDDFPSHHDKADAPLLSWSDMQMYYQAYAPDMSRRNEPDASPLNAPDLSILPPTFIAWAEHDPLRDEARAYAQKAVEAGVAVVTYDGTGLLHGSLRAWRHSPEAAGLAQAFFEFCRLKLHGVAA